MRFKVKLAGKTNPGVGYPIVRSMKRLRLLLLLLDVSPSQVFSVSFVLLGRERRGES